jgi:hypothetical protein
MSHMIEYTEQLFVQHCINCGIAFGFPNAFDERLRKTHAQFYCPMGHPQFYNAESEEQKLKKQLAEKERLLQVKQTLLDDARKERDTAIRSRRAVQAHANRVKHKTAAGVCPVDGCKRHFTNLQRHIKTKHPSWSTDDKSE